MDTNRNGNTMSTPTFKHFGTAADTLAYVFSELLATLRDDLNSMEKDEPQMYTDEDREDMRARIADIETLERLVQVPPSAPAPVASSVTT
ncbi:MAG: hypothetical protein LCH79_16230 [Proteobacteria bacterium]|nr:hypothetical protein [Pseudomonadota bacterium]